MKKGVGMKKFMTLMSGNNRIVAIVIMAVVAGSNMLGGPDLNAYVDPLLELIGFDGIVGADGKVYGSADILTLFYSLFCSCWVSSSGTGGFCLRPCSSSQRSFTPNVAQGACDDETSHACFPPPSSGRAVSLGRRCSGFRSATGCFPSERSRQWECLLSCPEWCSSRTSTSG